MVNSKKVAGTLPLPKKLPLVEELSTVNKGKGNIKVSSVVLVLI